MRSGLDCHLAGDADAGVQREPDQICRALSALHSATTALPARLMWHAITMQASAKKGIRAERVLEEKKQEQAALQKERLLLDRRNKKRRAELDRKVGLLRFLGLHAAGCSMPLYAEHKVRMY